MEEHTALTELLKEIQANQQSLHDDIATVLERLTKVEALLVHNKFDTNESYENGVAFFDDPDELYEDAVLAVREAGKASTSYIQRKLRVGYSRAARLIDLLEENGVIGPASGATSRTVIDTDK
jgi:DNA segregation ATPase FtsK/SpoIIIE-like protein